MYKVYTLFQGSCTNILYTYNNIQMEKKEKESVKAEIYNRDSDFESSGFFRFVNNVQ